MRTETSVKRGRDQFHKFRRVFAFLTSFYRLFPLKKRVRFLEKHRYMRGKLGLGVRYAILKSVAVECGDNVGIFEGVHFIDPQHLRIGSNVSIHPMCYIDCGKNAENGLIIGSDVSIAHGTTIMDTTHSYTDRTVNIKDQPLLTLRTEICDNVWIGAKATVLAGNTVREGCVIGAGTIVTKSTEPDCVYVGTPARLLKRR